jgi:hypothetical protein
MYIIYNFRYSIYSFFILNLNFNISFLLTRKDTVKIIEYFFISYILNIYQVFIRYK